MMRSNDEAMSNNAANFTPEVGAQCADCKSWVPERQINGVRRGKAIAVVWLCDDCVEGESQ